MTIFLLLVFAVVTFGLLPLAVYAGAARLMAPREHERLPLFLLTAPLAPLVLGLVLMAIYSSPMMLSPRVVIFIVLAAIAAALFSGSGHVSSLLKSLRSEAKRFRVQWTGTDILLCFLLTLAVLQIATLPLMENDAIEYAAVARHIFEARSLGVYPVLEAAPNGLFAPSSHPPAYHMYLVWGYSWMGVENFAPARLLALFCLCGMASLLTLALYDRERRTKVIALILILSVPLFTSMLVGYHIDALRLVSFLAAAIAVAGVVERPTTRQAVLTGFVLGLAGFVHSIGILTWVFAGLAWLLLGPFDRFRNFQIPLIIGAMALVVGGPQFIKNMVIFGVPLQDSAPVLDLPELRFGEDLRYRRDLVVAFDRFLFGAFRGFVELPLFSLSFWLAAIALWRLWRDRIRSTVFEKVAALWILSYFAIALVTALIGIDLVIKNARYVMTVTPLAVALAAPLLSGWLPRSLWSGRALGAVLALLAGWMVLQSVVRLANYARVDIALVGERAPIYRADSRFPGAPLYRYIEQHLLPGERTLVFRQADFALYGTGAWVDNFDTALIPFYRLSAVGEAHAWLKARNVRFVLVPDYTLPTYYRTVAGRLLGDSRLVEVVGAHRGFRLYRLRDAVEAHAAVCDLNSPTAVDLVPWSRHSTLSSILGNVAGLPFLGIDSYAGFADDFDKLYTSGRWQSETLRMVAPYASGMRFVTGAGPVGFLPHQPQYLLSSGGELVSTDLELSGSGFVTIHLVEYRRNRTAPVSRLWDGLVTAGEPARVALQFNFTPETRGFRLLVEKSGRARADVEVKAMRVCRQPPTVPASAPRLEEWAVWKPETLNINCKPGRGGGCNQTEELSLVRERMSEGIRLWGRLSQLTSVGFEPGWWQWRFKTRAWLEDWRVSLEMFPEATITGLMKPIYLFLERPASRAPLVDHSIEVDVAGQGTYSAYVQYTTPTGTVDWRYADSFALDDSLRSVRLDVELPADAVSPELVLIGSASILTIGTIRLHRAEQIASK